jgi:transketolase
MTQAAIDRKSLIAELEHKARFLRVNALALNNRTLHAGGALSSADLFTALFYHVLRIDPKYPQWEDRDIFINSRGHACEPVYVAMGDLGFFPWEDLQNIEDFGSHLHGLTATTTPGIEVSMGSLGSGISIATGMALSLRAQNRPGRVFIVTGDGELQEGLSWEGALSAGKYGPENLVVIVDRNKYQSNDRGTETVQPLEPLDDKFKAFGFAVRRIDGHNMAQIVDALEAAPLEVGKPTCIIADTIKGKGVSFLESGHVHCGRFGRDYEPELLDKAIAEIQGDDDSLLRIDVRKQCDSVSEIPLGSIANVFSEKLHEWAEKDDRICYVGVDTMDVAFEKKYPGRAFDVGIAEQDELCMATGLSMQGLIPVIQAWAPFTPLRNFDQLRTYLCRHQCNAKIIGWALGLVNNSHGTTHHDLESIALYRVVPNLTVLTAYDDDQFRQAFDAAMAIDGPVVLLGQPEHYAPGSEGLMDLTLPQSDFVVGKNQWVRRGSDVTLVSYGPALRYTWKAADELEAAGVSVGIVHVTSIKPFDEDVIEEAANTTKGILVVEEQSIVGGVGSAVAEVIAERGLNTRFKRMGIQDKYIEDLGDWTYTRGAAQLSVKDVIKQANNLIIG